jgi:hypothetical protein
MARGWESKSVEAQQEEAAKSALPARAPLTPQQAASARARQRLELARKQVLDQLDAATNSRHRAMLELALADLHRQLAALK